MRESDWKKLLIHLDLNGSTVATNQDPVHLSLPLAVLMGPLLLNSPHFLILRIKGMSHTNVSELRQLHKPTSLYFSSYCSIHLEHSGHFYFVVSNMLI